MKLAGVVFAFLFTGGCVSATPAAVRSCVDRIFTDPDAYDPAAHFEIAGDQAPPFPEAAAWVNDALTDCLFSRP